MTQAQIIITPRKTTAQEWMSIAFILLGLPALLFVSLLLAEIVSSDEITAVCRPNSGISTNKNYTYEEVDALVIRPLAHEQEQVTGNK